MAMTIFLVLNGAGVVFLLYVLANFWKEGRRIKNNTRTYAAEFRQRDWADVMVVTHPISPSAPGGLSVIPFRPVDRCSDKPAHGTTSCGTSAATARRISTR